MNARGNYLLAVMLLGAALVMVAACGGAQTPAPAAAPAGQSQSTTPAAAPKGSGGGGGGDGGGAGGANATATTQSSLTISGKVAKEITWSEAQVRAMPTAQATAKNSSGQESTYTGVPVNALLDQAGPQAGATTIVFTGEGGQTAQAELDKVRACSACVVSFRSRGGFSLVMPGFADGVQLKGLTGIEVK